MAKRTIVKELYQFRLPKGFDIPFFVPRNKKQLVIPFRGQIINLYKLQVLDMEGHMYNNQR